jgi:hypothetical protein
MLYKWSVLAELAMAAGVIAATLLQFVGALAVREYAKALWMREVRMEIRTCEFGGTGWFGREARTTRGF